MTQRGASRSEVALDRSPRRTYLALLLGSVTQTWAAREARQINDIFGAAGAGAS
ncbi:MAG: hypothetical protein WCC53_13670 [Thermoanaerobaculia bacterium]|jgi:hypothetical protein